MVGTSYFHGTLKGYENLENRMYIPRKFALDNGLSSGDLILKDVGNEGSWTVNLRNHMGKQYYFQVGLKEFCNANGLKKGDTVRFELIQNGKKPVAIISRFGEDEMRANLSSIPNGRQTVPTETRGSTSNNKNNPKYPGLTTKQFESHGMVGTRSFVGILQEYDNSRKRMYIPKKFAVENGLNSGECGK